MNRVSRSPIPRAILAMCFSVFVVGVAATRAPAADFYVAPDGSDGNPGSQASPWLTIQKAADTLSPGDTAFVRAGSYAKTTINVSGSAEGGFVTFRNFPGETPIIDATGVTPPADNTALFLLEDRRYVAIDGFVLRNYQTAEIDLIPAGILLDGACQHVEIRHCEISGIENTAGNPDHSGNAFGIAVYGSAATPATDIIIDGNDVHHLKTGASESVTINGNVTNFRVTNNTVHDNNNIGIDFIGFEGTCPDPAQDQARDGVCSGNTVWNISSQGNQAYNDGDYSAGGLYCDGATRIRFKRNNSHDNDIGIELASEHPGKLTSAIKVKKNTFTANRQTGLFMGGYAETGTGGTTGCVILRNTFAQNDTLGWDNGEAQLRFRTSDCVLKNNVFHAGPRNWLITVPVSADNNINNILANNVYYSDGGKKASMWSWNNQQATGFAAWKNISGQDAISRFKKHPPVEWN